MHPLTIMNLKQRLFLVQAASSTLMQKEQKLPWDADFSGVGHLLAEAMSQMQESI